jgi:hypothetical protein
MNIQRHSNPLFRTAVLYAFLMAGSWSSNAAAQQAVSFAEDIFPIIELRCLECHQPGGAGYETSGLDMRTYEGLMKGTKHGPVVLPRRSMESNLIAVIDHRTDEKMWMPHEKRRVSKCERLLIRFWVDQGANDN